MKVSSTISKFLALPLALALCGTPEMAEAMQNPAPATQQNSTSPDNAAAQPSQQGDAQQGNSQQNNSQQNNSLKPDPSAGPQVPTPGEAKPPVESNPNAQPDQGSAEKPLPEAPSATSQPVPQQPTVRENPVGTAVAGKATARGGAASKPAGAAIAPAKQHQGRALILKIGAIAAGAAALGTVYALTRGTASAPPGAAAGVR